MKDLKYFKTKDFYSALRDFFKSLNVPVNYIAEEPARPKDILSRTFKADKDAYQLMEDVYFLGMVDDAAFEGGESLDYWEIKSDYDGILIFGVTLNQRDNDLPPTRTQLAEITRAFNREFHYTPVVVVFRYDNLLSFANAERLPYKQEWREGEKAGKVSLLRDVDIERPHSGHLRILSELAISRSGKQAVNSFSALYSYWQTVFNVSLLNKKFYEELSNWYFWAIKEVTFPGEPTIHTLFEETGSTDEKKLQEFKQEHNAKNVIRLLTRFLFVWFIKEKKLIPTELFDLNYVKDKLIKDLTPYHQSGSLFQSLNKKSHYYKAILQNLFFATLNQEMGKRDFRKDKQHMNVTNLLRYGSCFKNSQKFIDLVEETVPFMNGGLFECLDKPHPTEKGPRGGDVIVYKDGFSDREDNPLVVPDYLFFGIDEEVDLSQVMGIDNKKTKQAAVKGLVNIFESYKFTITENTPIEEDIALDPELLGKVFENLLASYNPETKTTARKQTGSFYTPREIVNYMVDESLIAYLKNALSEWDMEEDDLDNKLHQLLSFDPGNPFAGNTDLEKAIIKALDTCSILDPACGSGAFPMGILQKMVHVLQKLDPDNTHWHDLQMEKALKETETAFHLVDKEAREQKLLEINEAFDEQINDPDYARKLFLIENCIYGVDIQPIAAQISKLRFFISLVVDQKVDKNKENFGIRPLPNLETKFVAANTLIGIEKPEKQGNLFANKEVKKLEEELKIVRHRIFSAKTPKTKRKLREEDQALREKMGELLIADGWANKTARQLAAWDPYDQNESSPFFDPEWMFGMNDGFDVVIGNPPYVNFANLTEFERSTYRKLFSVTKNKTDLFAFFIEKGSRLTRQNSLLSFIIPHTWKATDSFTPLRKLIFGEFKFLSIVDLNFGVFEAIVRPVVIVLERVKNAQMHHKYQIDVLDENFKRVTYIDSDEVLSSDIYEFDTMSTPEQKNLFKQIENTGTELKEIIEFSRGIKTSDDKRFITSDAIGAEYHPVYRGKNIKAFKLNWAGEYIWYRPDLMKEKVGCVPHTSSFFEVPEKIVTQRVNSSYQLLAAYDNQQNYFLDTVNVSRLSSYKRQCSIKSICSILNSKVVNFWYCLKYRMPTIGIYELHSIPIAIPNSAQDVLLSCMTSILSYSATRFFNVFKQVNDALVFQLYFPAHMKEKQIDTLQFVEKDLTEVMNGRDFEQLPDSEKETVINQLYARWTHPDSEVRNRIKLFAVRSPDILKPILESR